MVIVHVWYIHFMIFFQFSSVEKSLMETRVSACIIMVCRLSFPSVGSGLAWEKSCKKAWWDFAHGMCDCALFPGPKRRRRKICA